MDKNKKLLDRKYKAAQYILANEPDKDNCKIPLDTFNVISIEIADTILNTRLSSTEDSFFKNLVSFNNDAQKHANNIVENFLDDILPYNIKFDSCHFLAGTIMAYDQLVNESQSIQDIKNLISNKKNEKEILQEINLLMPDIKRIEKSDNIKEWIPEPEKQKKLITAFKEIMKKLEWIRTAFFHSSLDVTGEPD